MSVKNIASSGARGRSNVALLTPLNVPAGLSINTALALKLMDDLLNGSAMHNETGGTHCSALAFRKKLRLCAKISAGTIPSTCWADMLC